MPIASDASAAIQTVEAIAASFGMPASASILGLTKRIYAMAMNVVMPASNSVRTVEPFSRTLKNRSTKDGGVLCISIEASP